MTLQQTAATDLHELIVRLGKHKVYAHVVTAAEDAAEKGEQEPTRIRRGTKVLHFVYKETASFVPQPGGGAYRTNRIVFSGHITVDIIAGQVTAWDYDTDEMHRAAIQRKLNIPLEKILSC